MHILRPDVVLKQPLFRICHPERAQRVEGSAPHTHTERADPSTSLGVTSRAMRSGNGSFRMRTRLAISFAVVLCLSTRAEAQAPAGEPVGGISCDAQEGQRIHIHQRLVILDHGKAVAIPKNVGQPAAKRCIYWLHTHTPDGIIHVEAPQDRSFTLGDFFTVWGQPLSTKGAAGAVVAKRESEKVWVNGKAYAGDPRKIPLVAHADIVIQVGPPYAKPAAFTAWGTL